LALLFGTFAFPLGAQHLAPTFSVSPNSTGNQFSVALASQEVDYDYDPGRDADIERVNLGAALAIPTSPDVAFVGQFALAADSELDSSGENLDGYGFQFGFGAYGKVHQVEKTGIFVHGLLNSTWDFLERDQVEFDQRVLDLHLGGTASYEAQPSVSLYGGLDAAFLSNGNVDIKIATLEDDADVERDSRLSLFAGLTLKASNMVFRPQLTLGGEQTFLIAVHFAP
jgi:hypothetical protein